MAETKDIQNLIETDPDFIAIRRYKNSLSKLLEKHPDGVTDKVIANALMIPVEEVEVVYQNIIQKIQKKLKVNG